MRDTVQRCCLQDNLVENLRKRDKKKWGMMLVHMEHEEGPLGSDEKSIDCFPEAVKAVQWLKANPGILLASSLSISYYAHSDSHTNAVRREAFLTDRLQSDELRA